MSNLALRVPLGDGESPVSFVSRLAMRNCCANVRVFCLDMGLPFQDVVDGDPTAINRLAALGGADHDLLARWSARKVSDDLTYEIAGQQVPRPMLCRSQIRVCPACVAADFERWPRIGAAAPYGRAAWQISSIRTCPVHGLSLVEVARDHYPSQVHDFCTLTNERFRDIASLTALASRRPPSYLDIYLQRRLAGDTNADTPWLNALPFYAAAKLCEIVGAIEIHSPQVRINNLTDEQWWAAGDTGFETLAPGPDGLRRLLDHLASRYWYRSGGTGPKALFGRLYEWLAHESDDTAYDPVRDVIRQHLIDTLPMGPGDDIFGQPVTERRLHSIRSAQMETGTHPKRLRKLLIAGGFVYEDELDRTDDRLVFVADEAACRFLAKVQGAMPLKEAGQYLNAPRVQIRLLVEHGFVTPFIRGGNGALKDHAFAKVDLDDFLARLTTDAVITDDIDCLVDIPTAARQTRCSATDIVRLILDRGLDRVGRAQDATGYMSVLVDPDEVRPLVRHQPVAGLSLKEVERRMNWSQDVVKALVAHGHLPSQVTQNPINHLRQTVIAQEDLEAFSARYVSLHGLAKERGAHFSRVKRELGTAGTHPVFDPATVAATFYRRADLPPI